MKNKKRFIKKIYNIYIELNELKEKKKKKKKKKARNEIFITNKVINII